MMIVYYIEEEEGSSFFYRDLKFYSRHQTNVSYIIVTINIKAQGFISKFIIGMQYILKLHLFLL